MYDLLFYLQEDFSHQWWSVPITVSHPDAAEVKDFHPATVYVLTILGALMLASLTVNWMISLLFIFIGKKR